MATPIAYGADWSATQIYGGTLSNFRYTDGNGRQWPLEFVLRYADFPGQGHAVLTAAEYESHLSHGIRSLLIYQRTTRDPDGGEPRGREFGHAAVAYARSIGYRPGEPIFATADAPIGSYNLDVAEAFFRGFASVVRAAGFLAGGYGFRDVIYRLQDRGVCDVLWLCGAESGWRPGIAIYQWNNGRIYPAGVEADLCKQFEPIPGAVTPEPKKKEDDMSKILRGSERGDIYVVTVHPSGDIRKLYISDPNVVTVYEAALQTATVTVDQWKLDYIPEGQLQGPSPVDVQALIDGLVPPLVAAVREADTEGLTAEETIEAVREALRRGTGV